MGTGVKQWDRRFGGSSQDTLQALQQTSDGDFILGGYSFSGADGDKSESSRGMYDYWIVKVDSNGAKTWDRRFGGSGWDILWALQQTSDGGFMLGGFSESGADGDKSEASRGARDYWITKLAIDTDCDGMEDPWEMLYGLNPSNSLDALTHADNDGADNLSEYIAGTNPTNGADYLKFDRILKLGNAVRLDLMSHNGRLYDIDSSSNLLQSAWSPVTGDVAGTDCLLSITNFSTSPRLFYRVGTRKP